MIRDWTEGNLHEDVIQHNAIKMETKEEIIQLSLDYSLASEFTSFVAIEDRSKDNQIQAAAPSISELIEKENVDSLDYMGFESILLIEEENEKPKSQFSDQNLSLETCLEFAKLADMSKRYDDVIVLMENVIGSPLREENLLFEEIKLYKDACSIKLKSLEESWKSLHTIEEDQIQKNLWQNVTEIMKGKRKVEKEIKQLVEKISKLGETEVVTKSGIESQIGFLLLVKEIFRFSFVFLIFENKSLEPVGKFLEQYTPLKKPKIKLLNYFQKHILYLKMSCKTVIHID